MRAAALVSSLVTLTLLGCEYVEAEPGDSQGASVANGEGGASGVNPANGGAPPEAIATSPTSGQQACRAVCTATTQSDCVEATTDLEVCTQNCGMALADDCGLPLHDYLLCAETGGEVICPYGPVVLGCEDLFFEFLDCAGLD